VWWERCPKHSTRAPSISIQMLICGILLLCVSSLAAHIRDPHKDTAISPPTDDLNLGPNRKQSKGCQLYPFIPAVGSRMVQSPRSCMRERRHCTTFSPKERSLLKVQQSQSAAATFCSINHNVESVNAQNALQTLCNCCLYRKDDHHKCLMCLGLELTILE